MRDLIRRILMEEEKVNPVKKYFFDLWDEQKSLGEIPRYDHKMVKRLGFRGKANDIMGYYREYVGNVYDLRKEFERYLTSKKEFTTDYMEDLGIHTGGYDFSFKFPYVFVREENNQVEIFVDFDITHGSVTLMTNGEEYDLTDHDSIDENLWWELDMEIKDMVKGFVIATTDSFGIEFDDIYLQWG
jgi:hypothetical protein